MFEPEVFRKQMYGIEESTCDIVGIFRRPSQSFCASRSDSTPGGLCLPPRYAPVATTRFFPATRTWQDGMHEYRISQLPYIWRYRNLCATGLVVKLT